MGLIDSHAHLTFPELRGQINDVLSRCDAAGVERVITIGTDLEDTASAIEMARRYPGHLHAAAGFHPHEADKVGDGDLDAMASLWDDPAVIAAGEMGLDHHYDLADRAKQRAVFAGQLERARARDLPIIVHCREALDDAVPVLVDSGYRDRRVVFHCFTGTAEEAERIAEHGWRISFTGIVTFPKSVWLHEIAKRYPADQLMVETDSPYLSPVPLRGKHPNEPARVSHIARFLAELRGVALEDFVALTRENTTRFFGL